MKDDARARREDQIAQAAYAVLEEKGFSGASMLAIAKRAKASNETLYNWYSDKTGLFKALVSRNAAEVRGLLEADLDHGRPATETLHALGPKLLKLLLSDRAVALNRAAAADASGVLGEALSTAGREAVLPLLARVMERGRAAGELTFEQTPEAVELYVSLLVGDWQIRRAIGRMPAPDKGTISARADMALRRFLILMR